MALERPMTIGDETDFANTNADSEDLPEDEKQAHDKVRAIHWRVSRGRHGPG